MPDILELQEKLQDTTAAIAQLEHVMIENPETPSLGANLRSLHKRREELEAVFLELTNQLEQDVCRYRLFVVGTRPTITGLAQAWTNFQNAFSVIYDALKNGPKVRGRIGVTAAEETALGFSYSFTGSVGIVMTMPNERLLLGQTLIDQAIRTMFDLAGAHEHKQIREFAKTLGPAPVRAMYYWANSHVQYGMGAEIEWRREKELRARLLIQEPELARLTNTILQTSDEISEEVTYTGTLRAADLDRRTFRMELDDESSVKGTFDDAIDAERAVTLPRRYIAKLVKTTKVYYSTEIEDVSYRLLSLRRPGEDDDTKQQTLQP
ncbi:MAG TPA: hypothetical protein VKG65_12230 [Terriglobales bacterium]|nr:hypothetical protein [Terriglobales bacterium]